MHVASNQDRQRARSLSSVPDLQGNHDSMGLSSNVGGPGGTQYEVQTQSDRNAIDENSATAAVGDLALGRVYTASSLPSHIWSLNGKCFFLFLSYYTIL